MSREYGLRIAGAERAAASGDTFAVHNPATGELLGRVASAGEPDVADACAAAAAAFPAWARASESRRAGVLRDWATAIREHADELAELETRDVGKPIGISRKVDLRTAPDAIEYFAGMAGKVTGQTVKIPGSFLNYTVREPRGVVAGIIPWNYPLLQAIWKIAPAIMAGNTIVLKPAEQALLAPLLAVRLLDEVAPPGVVNAVPGVGEVAGAALCRDPRVRAIAFTGSTETGAAIQAAASARAVPVTLELGGKSPNLVFDDVDIPGAVATSHTAFVVNQGENCHAGTRLLVQDTIYDEFLDALRRHTAETTVLGDPMDDATTMGPLIDGDQLKRVQGFVDGAVASGAEILTGGATRRVDGLDSELFFEPTIVTGVDNASEIAQNEVFGPVVVAMPFTDEDHAVALANDTRYGLAAGVQTRDVGRALRVAGRLEAGNVYVNSFGILHSSSPYGGYKLSGHGREMGFSIMDFFTQEKSVFVSTR
ncbi:aldehyde dehydrogenase family protein [Actinomycetospora sp. C-140]